MATDESATLDPVEFVPERTELGLDMMGIRVRDADWGDSEHELFMVRQALGEIPADRHPPNRKPTMKLIVEEDSTVNLAEAAIRLQKKVGLIQREGGFARRDLDTGSGFEGSVAGPVHNIALKGIHGWMMAHRKRIPEVELAMEMGPYLYGVDEVELAVKEVENARRAEYEIKEGKGSAPGLIRVSIKNKGAAHCYGLVHSLESRYSSGDATAKQYYEAESLSIVGKGSKGARTGASGEVVKSGSLSNNFEIFLNSKIGGTEYMTHIGSRRVLVRVYDPNSSPGLAQLRLEWRSLGSNSWTKNNIVSAPLSGGFSIIDLGEVIPEQAVLGDQRWEWRLAGKTGGEIGDEIEVDYVAVLSTEQYLRVQGDIEGGSEGAIIWEDGFQQTEGNLTGKTAPVGGVYTGAGDADDFKVDDANNRAFRLAKSDSSINNGRFVIAGAAELSDVVVTCAITDNEFTASRAGHILRYTNTSNYLRATLEAGVEDLGGGLIEGHYLVVEKVVAGVVTELIRSGFRTEKGTKTLETSVTVDGTVTAKLTASKGTYISYGIFDSALATGGALQKGKVGLYDCNTSSTEGVQGRRYQNVVAKSAEAEANAVCYSERKIELRTDGLFRQHATDDVWARIVPNGFLPYFPPAGLEERVARGIVILSQGNFEGLADSGDHDLDIVVRYFPGYHYTSEAE